MNKIRTIFVGTSEFAVPILKELENLEFVDLRCVVSQPDQKIGRKMVLTPMPVKEHLLVSNSKVDVQTPDKIKDASKDLIENYEPELIIVSAYGQIIPQNLLSYPKFGCLNVHGSILPKLRGAVPVHMAVLNGLEKTGVTLQRMVMKMDAGNIIATKEINIEEYDTTESLMKKLAILGAGIIHENLEIFLKGELSEVEQNESEATFCYREDISKEKSEIKFDSDIDVAERMVRAFLPWPVAWIKLKDGRSLKIYGARIVDHSVNKEDGLTLEKKDKRLLLKLKNGTLDLLEVQLEGKRRDVAKNYFYLV